MTQTITELEVIESLDFHEEQACAMCEAYGITTEAEVYLWRPPCAHFPEGRVFPACKEWKQAHFPGTRPRYPFCCPDLIYREDEIRYVGPIK